MKEDLLKLTELEEMAAAAEVEHMSDPFFYEAEAALWLGNS